MKIGIDLDGVVFDTEKAFRIAAEVYEVQELKQNTIKDNRKLRCQERYSWNEEEIQRFLNLYHEKIVRETNYIVGSREILNLLKKERTHTNWNNSKRRNERENNRYNKGKNGKRWNNGFIRKNVFSSRKKRRNM